MIKQRVKILVKTAKDEVWKKLVKEGARNSSRRSRVSGVVVRKRAVVAF